MMGEFVGYARVSTTDQDLSIQREQLVAAGCKTIFSESRSGTTMEAREELSACLDYVSRGGVLVVTRLDRLARSTGDLIKIVGQLQEKGVELRCIHQPVDTTTPHGKLFLVLLAAIAEFETELRRDRQMEGIERAKTEGKYRGRKPTAPVERIREMASAGVSAAEIAKTLGVSKATVRRATPGMWHGVMNGRPQADPSEDRRASRPGNVLSGWLRPR